MNLEACLPPHLRTPDTTITRIARGLSGAGVYRVEAGGQAFVLKVAGDDAPLDGWRRTLHVQRLVADAGVVPPVVHVDEARRAVLSAFVADRSFAAFCGDPRTREAAVTLLGRTLRRAHSLPIPGDAESKDARQFLAALWSALDGFAVPDFVGEAAAGVLEEEAPPSDRAPVLSHNDVNPSNLVYDGERLFLLDWETAGPNEPLYDLAVAAVFFRMDDAACQRLIAAYDDAPLAALPARFDHDRRLAATLAGTMFLRLARDGGHAGATGAETLDATPSLGDLYGRMRAGALDVASAEGQWCFGLGLVAAGAAVGTSGRQADQPLPSSCSVECSAR